MEIVIKKLLPEMIEDYLQFFDSVEFKDHPHWSACYCYSFHFTGKEEDWSKENNRRAVAQLISQGKLTGYLAYKDERPVGWCNVNERKNYQALTRWYTKLEPGPEKALSIVCFLIHPDFRGIGIADKILKKILEDSRNIQIEYLEAYPGKNVSNTEGHYKGPLSMYTKRGFLIVDEFEDYYLVQKKS